jgi:hypothetical protein
MQLITTNGVEASTAIEVVITATTDLGQTHNLGRPPVVQFVWADGSTEYLNVDHGTAPYNSFTYTSAISMTGLMFIY